jgi:hypothetical protein
MMIIVVKDSHAVKQNGIKITKKIYIYNLKNRVLAGRVNQDSGAYMI